MGVFGQGQAEELRVGYLRHEQSVYNRPFNENLDNADRVSPERMKSIKRCIRPIVNFGPT